MAVSGDHVFFGGIEGQFAAAPPALFSEMVFAHTDHFRKDNQGAFGRITDHLVPVPLLAQRRVAAQHAGPDEIFQQRMVFGCQHALILQQAPFGRVAA